MDETYAAAASLSGNTSATRKRINRRISADTVRSSATATRSNSLARSAGTRTATLTVFTTFASAFANWPSFDGGYSLRKQ